jgi:hypothetical protein
LQLAVQLAELAEQMQEQNLRGSPPSLGRRDRSPAAAVAAHAIALPSSSSAMATASSDGRPSATRTRTGDASPASACTSTPRSVATNARSAFAATSRTVSRSVNVSTTLEPPPIVTSVAPLPRVESPAEPQAPKTRRAGRRAIRQRISVG